MSAKYFTNDHVEHVLQAKFGTRAVHAGQHPDPVTGAVIPPLSLSTTFKQHGAGEHNGFDYSRSGNPSRLAFETAVAALEGAKYGLAFSSGSATTATIVNSLPAGSHIVSVNDVYGGTYRYFTKVASALGVEVTFVDLKDASNIESVIRPNTKLIWVETPTNPTLRLVDIKAVAEVAHKHNTKLVVDNTFMSPFFQNPISLALEASPRVENVIYPGLPSHPQHDLAKRQQKGFGGMISFRIKGDLATANAFLRNVKFFTLAESLGGVESLCELPATMTHGAVAAADRAALGITENLIRLSVGIEDTEDLVQDILAALEAAVKL
ncbi:hypothetical protein BG011_003827 [Mortierella polycephala]|uniref:cystathionine gamma-lyase n=1 Tax=Mortierella polycephala TaxID=41804 RepID=A0A9P6QHW8_9FUNG|nr:hypothetical protein BG011_003827 [Mortierella polycephala]